MEQAQRKRSRKCRLPRSFGSKWLGSQESPYPLHDTALKDSHIRNDRTIARELIDL